MSQQINLFSPAFRKRRLVVSARQAVWGLAFVVLAGGAAQAYLQWRLGGLSRELRDLQSLLQERRGQLDKLKAAAAARVKDPALEPEIARLEVELKAQRDNMAVLKNGAIGNQQGFSEYLLAFSRQAIDGLWLTGFTIAGSGEITLRGRVVNAAFLPDYIQRLNREAIMQGRVFAALEMHRPEAPAADKRKDERRAPRYLEFSLASVEAGTDVPSGGDRKAGRTP